MQDTIRKIHELTKELGCEDETKTHFKELNEYIEATHEDYLSDLQYDYNQQVEQEEAEQDEREAAYEARQDHLETRAMDEKHGIY